MNLKDKYDCYDMHKRINQYISNYKQCFGEVKFNRNVYEIIQLAYVIEDFISYVNDHIILVLNNENDNRDYFPCYPKVKFISHDEAVADYKESNLHISCLFNLKNESINVEYKLGDHLCNSYYCDIDWNNNGIYDCLKDCFTDYAKISNIICIQINLMCDYRDMIFNHYKAQIKNLKNIDMGFDELVYNNDLNTYSYNKLYILFTFMEILYVEITKKRNLPFFYPELCFSNDVPYIQYCLQDDQIQEYKLIIGLKEDSYEIEFKYFKYDNVIYSKSIKYDELNELDELYELIDDEMIDYFIEVMYMEEIKYLRGIKAITENKFTNNNDLLFPKSEHEINNEKVI